MKKAPFIFCIIVMAAMMAACTDETISAPDPDMVDMTFIGHVDDNSQTRTGLNEDFGIIWNSTDYITVFDGDGTGKTFSDVTVSTDGKTAEFKGSVRLADSYYAIYPAQEDASYNSEKEEITATLPTIQKAVNGTFADGINLTVAKTAGENLYFRNVGAILAVRCPTANAKSIKLVSHDPSVKMSGEATIQFKDGLPVAVPSESAVNHAEITCSTTAVGDIYYFVVYPGEYKGFDIIFTSKYTESAKAVFSTSKELDLKRNDNVMLFDTDGLWDGWNSTSAPSDVSAKIASPGGLSGVTLTWGAEASDGNVADGFNIYAKKAGSSRTGEMIATVSEGTYTYHVTGLDTDTTYDFGVQTKAVTGKKNSEITWVTIHYKDCLYPFEKERAAVPQLADMTLCYGGDPERLPYAWTKDRWKSHAVYTDEEGNNHWFFDSFLALETFTTYEGERYIYSIANTSVYSAGKAQWEQQLDYWFNSTNGFQAFDDCIDEAIATAGAYPHKRYVVFSLPDPVYCRQFADKNSSTTYWGSINGSTLDFRYAEERIKAYKWMIDQVRARFAEKNYRHIELAGFYILSENLSETYNGQYKEFTTVIPAVGEYCKDLYEGLYWIPYGYSISTATPGHDNAIKNWEQYRFTAAVLQPNIYWDDTRRDWEKTCKTFIYNENLGMELEFEGSHGEGGWSTPGDLTRTNASILETLRTSNDPDGTAKGQPNPKAERNKTRFREYMTNCKKYDIYGNRMVVLYSGTNGLHELATSTDEEDRKLYYELGEFIIDSPLKNN